MRTFRIDNPRTALLLGVVAAVFGATSALAGDHVYTATNAAWKEECASCHIAYPPQLLPAQSWHGLMTQLDRHFGTDAGIDDAKKAAEIAAFLETNAANGRRRTSGTASLRITDGRWFLHEHDEVPARVWKSAAVKSPANCEACHTRAAEGDFRERALRVPN